MSKLTYRGDAEDVAQETLLPNPPSGFFGEIKIGISNKTITLSEWNKEAIATAFNGSDIPEFDSAIASVTDDGVLLTAATAGVPFQVWVSYGGSSTFDEVLIFSKLNYSGTVSGFIDLTFKGETAAVSYDVNAASMQAALETLTAIDPGDTKIVDINSTQIKLTWSGQYAGVNVSSLTIDDSALRGGTADVIVTKVRDYRAGQNEIQRIVLGGGPTGGTILYDLDGTPIGPVDYDDVEADYQTAFDAALGAGEATVTGQTDTGEVGPLQTEDFVAADLLDTGFSWEGASSQYVTPSSVIVGYEQEIEGDAISEYPITGYALLSGATIPANLQIERALLQFAIFSATTAARIDLKIRAVNLANPTQLSEGDWADYSTRPLTTASVLWTVVQSPVGSIVSPPSLDAIVQELIDTHGAISDIMFYLETQPDSTGRILFYGAAASTGYVTSQLPTLLVDYRDGPSGAAVFDIEFIGGRAQKSLPLLTANIDSLIPKRQNTIWVIDTVLDTGAGFETPGVLQLYDGATQLQTAGTSEAPVSFTEGIVTVLDEQFGEGNHTFRTNVDDVAGRVEIELIEELSGAVNLSDDLLLYWTPISTTEVEEGSPVARMELVNEGGGGLGEKQRFLIEQSAISGTVAFTDGIITSAALPYNLTASQLQAALELFVGVGKVACSGTSSPQGILCEYDVSIGDVVILDVINNLRGVDAVLTDMILEEHTEDSIIYQTTIELFSLLSESGLVNYIGGGNTTAGTPGDAFFAMQTLYPNALSIVNEPDNQPDPLYLAQKIVLRTTEAPGLSITNLPTFQLDVTINTETFPVAGSGFTSTAKIDMLGPILAGTWELQFFVTLVGQTINVPIFIPDNVTGASAQYIRNALVEAIPQATEITVTGTTLSNFDIVVKAPFTVVFLASGNGLGGAIPIAEFQTVNEYEASANERQKYILDDAEFAGGGYVELTYEGVTVTAFYPSPDIWGVLYQIPALSGNLVVRPDPDNPGSWEIEFTGSLAGIDVSMISVESHIIGYAQSGFLTAYWSRSQLGSNGASVTITELQDGSPPLGEQGIVRVTNNPHFGTFTLTANGDTTPALGYNTLASLIQASLLSSGGAVLCIGDLESGVLCSFEPALGDVNLTAANIDLTNARFAVTEFIRGGELNTLELQRSAGKNHFDDPQNWKVVETGESRIPDSADEPIFETGRVPCLYGLQQRSTFIVDVDSEEVVLSVITDFRVGQKLMVSTDDTLPTGLAIDQIYVVKSFNRDAKRLTLQHNDSDVAFSDLGTGTHTIRLAVDALTHHSRFTAPIGLPHFNPSGYQEYLPTELQIGFDPSGNRLLKLGEGNGSSSGRMRFDIGSDQFLTEVHKTGGAIEVGVPALTINGTNDQNDYEQFDGSVGLGFFEGDEFRFKKLRIHSGSLLYGLIISSADCEFRNLGGSIDGREGQITGKIASKP